MTSRTAVVLVVLALLVSACGGTAGRAGGAAGPTGAASAPGGDDPATADAQAADARAGDAREAQTPGDIESTAVTVVLDWTPNTNHAGLYLAQANGWYADAGLDVTILQPGEQGGLPALASGDADFAVSVQEAVTPARIQGAPVVSIAAIIASNTSSLVALADEGIRRPRDLEGHTYGGFGGDLETELVRSLVECDGGDPDAVEFVEVGNVDYRAGLQRDFYDFVWIFEGWDGIRLEQAGVDTTSLLFSDYVAEPGSAGRTSDVRSESGCIPDWYTPLLATTEQMIAGQPEVVHAFLEATARGYETAITDPTAAADALLAAAPELDEQLVRASAEFLADEYAADGRPWGVQEPQVWEDFTAFLREAGIIEGDVDVDAAWTNAFLPARAHDATSEAAS